MLQKYQNEFFVGQLFHVEQMAGMNHYVSRGTIGFAFSKPVSILSLFGPIDIIEKRIVSFERQKGERYKMGYEGADIWQIIRDQLCGSTWNMVDKKLI